MRIKMNNIVLLPKGNAGTKMFIDIAHKANPTKYAVRTHCHNCGVEFAATIDKGIARDAFLSGIDCPVCGCPV
jgi:hypothetical protein